MNPMNRRHFLKLGGTGLVAAAFVPTLPAFAAEARARVGLIGPGWYGKSSLFRLLQVAPVEVVALCDVDKNMLGEAAGMVAERQVSKKRPRTHADYREMLREKDLDIVMVSTPDHWHALPSIEAMRSGADVYVEKPTGVDVVESQAMVAAARKYNRVVQVNTQRRSTPHLAEARDTIIKAGRLGEVGVVDMCCYWHMRSTDTRPAGSPPGHLDFDMWTGPAPLLPYHPMMHPRGWRAFMEYGNGIVGDMCVHMLDMVRWMLDLGWPSSISSVGGILMDKASKANISDTQVATFDFGKLKVTWQHRTWGQAQDEKYPWSATFYGNKGTLKASVFGYDFTPVGDGDKAQTGEALFEYDKYPIDRTEKDLERHVAAPMRRHWLNFLEAREKRSRPVADIEQAHISSASCILANLSMKLGRSLTWDAGKHEVVGDAPANAVLARPYRAPWVHPDPRNV